MNGALALARDLERLNRDSTVAESPQAMRVYLRRLFQLAKELQVKSLPHKVPA